MVNILKSHLNLIQVYIFFKIEASLEEDPWNEIVEENKDIETLGDTIEEEVHEDYIDEDKAI